VKKISVLTGFLSLAMAGSGLAADANFYRLNDRWEKAAATGKSREDAMDEGFARAIQRSDASIVSSLPVSPPLRRTLSQIEQSRVELEFERSLLVSANGILKYLATDAGRVVLSTADPNTLLIKAIGIGPTFVHVWDAAGRHSFEIQVTPPTYTLTNNQVRNLEAAEGLRPFRVGYEVTRAASYQALKPRELERRDMTLIQQATIEGDTPYGALSGFGVAQKAADKTIITDAGARLLDARIGPFSGFDAHAGDTSVVPGLMVFPEARIRGLRLDNETTDEDFRWSGFYGREKSGILGLLTPGVVSKRSVSSYLGGGTADYEFSDRARVKGGYFVGHGQARRDELNRRGMGVAGRFDLTPNVRFQPEVDFDSEHVAHKYNVDVKLKRFRLRNQWRDVSKKFYTLVGAPAQQGELGYSADFSAQPFENQTFSGALDIFRDRLIPNPANPDRFNVHRELDWTIAPDFTSSLSLNYRDLDETGRVGPSKQRAVGAAYNRTLELYGHRYALFGRWENRGYRSLTNSEVNYVVDQFFLGFNTPLFWGISFGARKEYNFLREPNINQSSVPHATTYSLDYSRQIENTPFHLNARFSHRDEEETESQNSFMSGEDATELSGGVTYRETEDFEIFLTGRIENYRPESLAVQDPRVEAEFLTGMRGTFDTGIRWSPTGSFEGFVFKDLNGDGSRTPDEPGLKGMTVSAEGKKAVTDERGFYELEKIGGKKTTLTLDVSVLPYGYVPTTSPSREAAIEPNGVEQVDFGVTPRSEIAGVVFNDLNKNGRFDNGEPGIHKANLILEDGKSASSRTNGYYSFGDVTAGAHTITLDVSSLPEGYLPSGPFKQAVTVFEGVRFEKSFPLRAVRGVAGRVFLDDDADRKPGPAEKGAADILVLLGDAPVLTDAEGYYLFDDVPTGRLTLAVDPKTVPAGYRLPEPVTIQIGSEPVSISDRNIALPKTLAVRSGPAVRTLSPEEIEAARRTEGNAEKTEAPA